MSLFAWFNCDLSFHFITSCKIATNGRAHLQNMNWKFLWYIFFSWENMNLFTQDSLAITYQIKISTQGSTVEPITSIKVIYGNTDNWSKKRSLFTAIVNHIYKSMFSPHRRIQIDPHLSPCRKFTSYWIKDQYKTGNIESDRNKVCVWGGGKNLELMVKEKDFLNRTALVQKLRSIINKWDLAKLKSFWVAKDTSFGKNARLQNGKRFCQTAHLLEALYIN